MMQEGFADTVFGRIHFLEAGTGSTLLLLHSNGGSAYQYSPVIEQLASTRRVIAWDMPGHGDSDPITGHCRIEAYAERLVAFMDAQGIETADILGCSVGGSICTAVAVRHPQRVRFPLIVETPARSEEAWRKRWSAIEENFAQPLQSSEQIRARIHEPNQQLLQRWNIDRSKAGAWTMMDVMWAIREYDIRADIRKLSQKALLLFGERGAVGDGIDMFKTGLPQAALIMMARCGHFPMLDDPEEFVRIVDEFLRAVPESFDSR